MAIITKPIINTPRRKPGPKEHLATEERQNTVTMHIRIGTPQEIVAKVLGIDVKTLRKHYRRELDLAGYEANAEIGGALFTKAKNGDTAAMIFWMKTKAGFKETSAIDHSSTDGSMTPKAAVKVTIKEIKDALKDIGDLI